MNCISLKLKSDFIEIYKTLNMLSKDIYTPELVEETVWLYNDNGSILGYVGYSHVSNEFLITIAKGENVLKREFDTRNDLIIYLKGNFISDLTAGLI